MQMKAVIKFGNTGYHSFNSFYTAERCIQSLDVLTSTDLLMGLLDNALFHESTIVRDTGNGQIEDIKFLFANQADFNISIIYAYIVKNAECDWKCCYEFFVASRQSKKQTKKFSVQIDITTGVQYRLDKMIGQVN